MTATHDRDPNQPPLKLRRSAVALAKAERVALLAFVFVVSVAASDGTTNLHRAISTNEPVTAIEALVKAGADVNARSRVTAYPHTPPGVIGDALEEGASYVGQTVLPKGGWTALMYAARQGALDAARALVDAGADLNVADPDGSPALTLAII